MVAPTPGKCKKQTEQIPLGGRRRAVANLSEDPQATPEPLVDSKVEDIQITALKLFGKVIIPRCTEQSKRRPHLSQLLVVSLELDNSPITRERSEAT